MTLKFHGQDGHDTEWMIFSGLHMAGYESFAPTVQLAFECLAADAEQVGGVFAMMVGEGESRENMLLLDLLERDRAESAITPGLDAGPCTGPDFLRKMLHFEGFNVFKDQDPLDHIVDLAYIARPVVRFHQERGLRVDLLNVSFEKFVVNTDKMLNEQDNIVVAVSYGWDADRDNIQTVKKIFAEFAVLDQFFKVLMRGGHHADIDIDCFLSAEALYFTVFEDPQDFRLQVKGHVADLIEEQSALVRALDASHFSLFRVGERPLLVAE